MKPGDVSNITTATAYPDDNPRVLTTSMSGAEGKEVPTMRITDKRRAAART